MDPNLWSPLKRECPLTTVWAGVHKEEGSDLWSLLDKTKEDVRV